MKLLLCALLSFSSFAQTVHVHKLEPDLKIAPSEGTVVHEFQPDLVKAQQDFQKKVFAKAQVEAKTQSLDFEAREDLLELLEEVDQAAFLKKYPQFSPAEAAKLKAALYE